jgi:hypothetical protein
MNRTPLATAMSVIVANESTKYVPLRVPFVR